MEEAMVLLKMSGLVESDLLQRDVTWLAAIGGAAMSCCSGRLASRSKLSDVVKHVAVQLDSSTIGQSDLWLRPRSVASLQTFDGHLKILAKINETF
jgi:hypothetical protein